MGKEDKGGKKDRREPIPGRYETCPMCGETYERGTQHNC
jgi:hypothetical protein